MERVPEGACFVRFCPVLSGARLAFPQLPVALRHWIRLSRNRAGFAACDPRPEAQTQFARRLIIGFGGAETNQGRRHSRGGIR
jgi:hypothetical protein